jgi:uncharacterized glyoxalase superfamily protein PhnB
MGTLTPHLVAPDPTAAAAWHDEVQGAVEESRITLPGGRVLSVDLRFGDRRLAIGDESPGLGIVSPLTLGGTYGALHLAVADADSVWQVALEAGAKVFEPLHEAFWGDYTGQFIDPFGHRWAIDQHLRDVPPDEVARLAAEASAKAPADALPVVRPHRAAGIRVVPGSDDLRRTRRRGRSLAAFAGVQAPYSLLRRDIERDLLPMAEALGLTVAARSPLADGILSGKFTGEGTAGQPTRIDPATLSEHQHQVAALVSEVAEGLGASPAQVAIAWTRARSPAICPVIGARSADQLLDNLGAAALDLPADALAQLDAATRIDLGFPATFIRDNTPWVFGAAALEGNMTTLPGR